MVSLKALLVDVNQFCMHLPKKSYLSLFSIISGFQSKTKDALTTIFVIYTLRQLLAHKSSVYLNVCVLNDFKKTN